MREPPLSVTRAAVKPLVPLYEHFNVWAPALRTFNLKRDEPPKRRVRVELPDVADCAGRCHAELVLSGFQRASRVLCRV